ncbi:MAG: 2-C-methyl-D-erythritol 2,4-cyclodiphosphate synthase [Baekduia sp.]|jgi:2-C-methyl-D-erythritol 2,4-cyclodiphosphate synthase|nr:2-C-methyl-D-erythritol 2,4-cyclodiphosphate synthase [Baekduia sp.]
MNARPPGVRTGIGWDSHKLVPERRLILGGVELEHTHGLLGHSDADVLTHAVIDALLGAAGLDDIGAHFPDTDAAYKDADSMGLLRDVVARVTGAGFAVEHVDTTVIMERPKLSPHRAAIRASLAAGLGVDSGSVNVKASTGEGLGFVGRGEGVAALAVATLLTP